VESEDGIVDTNKQNGPRVLKHPLVSRLFHWCLIVGFLPAALTGVIIWLKPGSPQLVNLAMHIHIIGAAVFTVASVLYSVFAFERVAGFLQEVFSWSKRDLDWLIVGGGYPQKIFLGKEIPVPPMGKINSGQKMMSIFMIYGGVFMLISGWVLYAFIPFSPKIFIHWLDFGHLWIGLFLALCMLAHIGLGIYNSAEFKAMFGDGTVSLEEAEQHNPVWVKEKLQPVSTQSSNTTKKTSPA
jgi:formate dehydrogenase subunit gamma